MQEKGEDPIGRDWGGGETVSGWGTFSSQLLALLLTQRFAKVSEPQGDSENIGPLRDPRRMHGYIY